MKVLQTFGAVSNFSPKLILTEFVSNMFLFSGMDNKTYRKMHIATNAFVTVTE